MRLLLVNDPFKFSVMKKLLILIIALLITTTYLFAQKARQADTIKHATFYTCPMHAEMTSDKAGKCSICPTDLVLSGKEKIKASSKTYACPVHLDVVRHDAGKCPKCGQEMNLSPKEQMKVEVSKIYTCEMHPLVALDKEGNCPTCGKALVKKKRTSN
jgi:hypothetical protein